MIHLLKNALAVYKDGSLVETDLLFDSDAGYFETMRLTNGQIPLWSLHQQRLERSASFTGLVVPDLSYITDICRKYTQGVYRARLTIIPATEDSAHSIFSIHPMPDSLDGFRLQLASNPHPFTDVRHTGIKLSQRNFYTSAFEQARTAGFDDALLFDKHGNISESCIANILLLDERGRLCTPSMHTMPIFGVGLTHLTSQLKSVETPVPEITLSAQKYKQINAMWLVNALRGVIPVVQINNSMLTPDPQTTRFLNSLFPF